MIGVADPDGVALGDQQLPHLPANGLGSSTIDLAVSISTRTSLTLTVSPTATRHVMISASVRPSPTSGSLNSLISSP